MEIEFQEISILFICLCFSAVGLLFLNIFQTALAGIYVCNKTNYHGHEWIYCGYIVVDPSKEIAKDEKRSACEDEHDAQNFNCFHDIVCFLLFIFWLQSNT